MSKLKKPVSANSLLKPVEEALVYNPMYLSHEHVRAQSVTYEEITLGGFRSRVRSIATNNVILPRIFSRTKALRHEDMDRLHPLHEEKRKRRVSTRNHVICLISGMSLLLSSKQACFVDIATY